MKKLSLPVEFLDLISKLDALSSFEPADLLKILKSSSISTETLLPWSTFDHDPKEGYGRREVFKGKHYEIMVMSWCSGDYTAVHNHGIAEWGAVKVFGRLEHINFKRDDNFISTIYKEKLSENEVLAVNQALIHQMGNPFDENCLSLHVYGTSTVSKSVTANSQIFEIGKHEIQEVNGGVFYDLKNNDIAKRTPGLRADKITEIQHYSQLLNLYHKANFRGAQYNAAINYFQNRSAEGRLNTEIDLDTKQILYYVELKKAQKLLRLHKEPTRIIDSILNEISDLEKYS